MKIKLCTNPLIDPLPHVAHAVREAAWKVKHNYKPKRRRFKKR
jgi:hypothetical protein